MLHRKKSTSRITKMMIEIAGREIPMIIYRERRRGWRVSIGQKSINLRIPDSWQYGMPENPIEWGVDWAKKQYAKKPESFDHFFLEPPHQGKIYQTLFGEYELLLSPRDRKTASGFLEDGNLVIVHPAQWDSRAKAHVFPSLISRVFASAFHSKFAARVKAINDHFYQFRYTGISFKYNKSNWGSCSSTGHLNFSTRLFLAPSLVTDYVIVHELAHLREHNHSQAFWDLVSCVMPNYHVHIEWLKEHGSKLYF